jgi:hypothetical protein
MIQFFWVKNYKTKITHLAKETVRRRQAHINSAHPPVQLVVRLVKDKTVGKTKTDQRYINYIYLYSNLVAPLLLNIRE